MTTRCKFICAAATEEGTLGQTIWSYTFNALTAGAENAQFFRWTPAGTLTLKVVRDNCFTVGGQYYLDISAVPVSS